MFYNIECQVDSISRFVDSMSQRYHSGALALLLPLNRQSVNVNFDTVDPYPLARDTELSGEWFPTLQSSLRYLRSSKDCNARKKRGR
jgi:hypothetical protein